MVMEVGTKKASGPVPHPGPQEGGAGLMGRCKGWGKVLACSRTRRWAATQFCASPSHAHIGDQHEASKSPMYLLHQPGLQVTFPGFQKVQCLALGRLHR